MSKPNIPATLFNSVPLTPAAVQTGSYTATANELIPADASGGVLIIALPSAPADKTRVTVKKIDSSTNAVGILTGGSDVLNKSGGPTSTSLTLQNQTANLQYASSSAIWYVIADGAPVASLNATYTQNAATPGGDLSGTYAAPLVTKINGVSLPGSAPTTGNVLTATGATSTAWTTPAAGVMLDTNAADIQPNTTTGTPVAGSTGKAADAGHQHALVAHDHSSTAKGGAIPEASVTNLTTDLAATEKTANKGAASGYAPLDSGSKLPIANIPTGVSSTSVALGNDSRFAGSAAGTAGASLSATDASVTNSRTPNGTAAGDLSGSYPSPGVAKINGVTLPGSAPAAGNVLTATSATATAWTTPAAGVTLDTTASDIQPLGTQAAGSTGKAADASHVHQMPRLDQVSAPTAAVALNAQKITGLANGTAATDAAAFGQIPTAGTGSTNYTAGNDSRVTGAIQSSTATAKGDLLAATAASTVTRLGVGSDTQVLTADSTQATGVKWATPSVTLTGDVTSVGNATTLNNTANVKQIVYNNAIAMAVALG